jgi:hypothetical protein
MGLLCLMFAEARGQSFSLDPKVGVQISMSSLQSILAAPPLPRIDGGRRNETPVVINYVTAQYETPDATNVGTIDEGEFSGYSYAAGLVAKEKNGARMFFWLMGNSVSGDINATSGGSTTKVSDLEAGSQAATMGYSKRLFGGTKSLLNFGAFGGATVINFDSTFIVPSSGGDIELAFSPVMYGALAGVQFNIYMKGFVVNPYYIYFKELSEKCKDLDGSGFCVDISGSFLGMGFNVGYKKILFNVQSSVLQDEVFDGIKTDTYGISYTFGLE